MEVRTQKCTWTNELAQQEREEWKRNLGNNIKGLGEKSPPQRLVRNEMRIHWKTSQKRIIVTAVKQVTTTRTVVCPRVPGEASVSQPLLC